MVYYAAFDWIVIGKISSVLGIASFLWMVYSETIRPIKEKDSDAGIIIHIEYLETTSKTKVINL